MPHLSSTCHGDELCLDEYARHVSTLDPGAILPLHNFTHLSIEEQGLVDIASRASVDFCSISGACELSNAHHPLKLVVEDNIVKVLNDDYGLCTCQRLFRYIPRSLSKCILSAWEIWLERLRRWEALMTDPEYRSPSPDLPPLDQLFAIFETGPEVSKKRPAEESEDEEDNASPSPPPAKRMRTGPCPDVVRKMKARSAEAEANEAPLEE
ncbi:hypothetical protein V5O48_010383 [Marasmius crinis-equi]|uniref:Uncharacterized protein n=1 Tax=Marasmius crinis-equi TaxID=585013 RepID=A0ABR3F8K9_9AGAR